MNGTLFVYGALLAVCVVVWLVQQARAHGRQLTPTSFQPQLGPIDRVFPTAVRNGPELIVQAALQVPGMSVASVVGDAVFLNTRPNIGRLDDGMGLFLRVISSTQPDGWHVRLEGQPKTGFAGDAANRGFVSVERQLRQALGRMGLRVDDGLSPRPADAAPAPPVAPPAPPVAPPAPPVARLAPPPPEPSSVAPPVATMTLVAADGSEAPVVSMLAIGRDPAASGSAVLVVDDPLASKTHAIIHFDGVHGWLEDRWSTNGTVVRTPAASRVAVPGALEALGPGDAVQIGSHWFVVRLAGRS